MIERLSQVLPLGAGHQQFSDALCLASTIRRRRHDRITARIITDLEQLCMETYDRIIGLAVGILVLDGA